MQDAKGKTLAVGQTVKFDTWEETKAGPLRGSAEGVVIALAGESRENQTLGEVTIKADKKEVTVPALAVTIVK